VQLVEGALEARDGLLGRVAGGDDQQAAVDVGLVSSKGLRLLLELRVLCVGAVLRVVEVLLRGVDLLLQQALLLGDARQQGVEVARVEVAGRLQLVVQIVGDAVAVGHVGHVFHAGGGRLALRSCVRGTKQHTHT
jgi:hypothetical protein